MQEVGKIYYYLRDYQNSYKYYKMFVEIRNAYKLDIYGSGDAKIGFVYKEMRYAEEGDELLERFRIYAENDVSIYKHANLALYYSSQNDYEKALDHLRQFSEQSNYFY